MMGQSTNIFPDQAVSTFGVAVGPLQTVLVSQLQTEPSPTSVGLAYDVTT
jgi:hypothetical protein